MTILPTSFNNPYIQQFQKRDINQLADSLFTKLDVAQEGVLTEQIFAEQLQDIDTESAQTAKDMMTLFDSDQDGVVTKTEFTQQLKAVQEELNTQYADIRHQIGMELIKSTELPAPDMKDPNQLLLDSLAPSKEYNSRVSLYERIQQENEIMVNDHKTDELA